MIQILKSQVIESPMFFKNKFCTSCKSSKFVSFNDMMIEIELQVEIFLPLFKLRKSCNDNFFLFSNHLKGII